MTPAAHRTEIESYLDELEDLGAGGWRTCLITEERERRLNKALVKYAARVDELEKEVESRGREIGGREDGRGEAAGAAGLRRGEGEDRSGDGVGIGDYHNSAAGDEHDNAEDIAAIGHLQRDLNSILMELRYLDAHAEDQHGPRIRGGGGQLEDEEHVYGDAPCKNWDQDSEEHDDVDDAYIQQLRDGIAKLEEEVKRLEGRKKEECEQLRKRSVVPDASSTDVDQHAQSDSPKNGPSLRGGSGREQIHTPIEPLSSSYRSLAEDFDRIYEQLMQNTVEACGQSPPSACTQAWMSTARILQLRNSYLERQLTEFREMYISFAQDLKWHMEKLEELEEEVETAKKERANALTDLEFARLEISKKDAERSAKGNGTAPVTKSLEEESADNGPSSQESSKEVKALKDTKSDDPSSCVSSVDYFIYFPRRSEIIYPASGRPLLHFSGAHTLEDIRRTLEYRHEQGIVKDLYEIRIREIMKTREEMGISLPDTLSESSVIIGIPTGPTGLTEPSSSQKEVDPDVEIAAWEVLDDEEDQECLKVHELRATSKPPFSPATVKPELHIRAFGNQHTSPEHIIDLAFNNSVPFNCSCATLEPKRSSIPYFQPYLSIRGGGDPDDDDDDYDSDNEDYELGGNDSDSDDDEVDHEDEASDPWDTRDSPKAEGLNLADDDLDGLVRQVGNIRTSFIPGENYVMPSMRGGGDSEPERERGNRRNGKERQRASGSSAPAPTRLPIAPLLERWEHAMDQGDFYDEDGYVVEDKWRTYYEAQRTIPGNVLYCHRSSGSSESLNFPTLVPSSSYQFPPATTWRTRSRSQSPNPSPKTRVRSANERVASCSGDANVIQDTEERRSNESTEHTVDEWLSPKPAPPTLTLGITTPSARSIHVRSRHFSCTDSTHTMPSHYLPPAQQLPSSTPPSLNAPSSTHRHPSLQERITQLLNALIKYIKHLPNLAKSKKPKAVPVLRAEMLVPSPPNYSRPGSWDPQHIRMHTFASTEIPLPAAPTPSRASSMSFATLNAPGSTIASSNYSLALSTVMLAPTPPRKNTPPIPARNPRRLGGGGDTGENVMDARGSSVLVGAVGEGDGYGVTDRAGPSDPERYMHVHIEKLRRERKRWDGT